MEEIVLLGTKPLVNSIRHFIRDPSGVFSVCHLCECRIVQWRHDSHRLLLLFLHIIKEHYTLARRYEFYALAARTISHSFALLTREILFFPLEHKIHIFSLPCDILYIFVLKGEIFSECLAWSIVFKGRVWFALIAHYKWERYIFILPRAAGQYTNKYWEFVWVDIGWILAKFFFACLWTETTSRSINTQKKNASNIQPCWPNKLGQ